VLAGLFIYMLTCARFESRGDVPGIGRADLVLLWRDGTPLETRGWSVYSGDGGRYFNPPTVRHGAGIANIMRITDRNGRDRFRLAALAAIDAFRAEEAPLDAAHS
jgi:hypothetical protein